MDQLSIDNLIDILAVTSTTELARLCRTNKLINSICNSDYFWKIRVEREFPDALINNSENSKDIYFRELLFKQYPGLQNTGVIRGYPLGRVISGSSKGSGGYPKSSPTDKFYSQYSTKWPITITNFYNEEKRIREHVNKKFPQYQRNPNQTWDDLNNKLTYENCRKYYESYPINPLTGQNINNNTKLDNIVMRNCHPVPLMR